MHEFSDLNDQQIEAVQLIDKPVAIIAGPGTGKTKTLVSKIQYLIEKKKFDPSRILALTFTNKAAKELRERVKSQNKNKRDLPFTSTFHGFCFAQLSNDEPVALLTDLDRAKIFEQLLQESKFKELSDLSLREVALKISRLKNLAEKDEGDVWTEFLTAYQSQLGEKEVLDFDDLLLKTVEHLSNKDLSPENTFEYILVDEFQDTNQIQYQLLKLLLHTHQNVSVIGDPYQSIYSFRGSSAEIFDQFSTDFPDSQTLLLQQNYRNSPQILHLSQSLFPNGHQLQPNNTQRSEVKLVSTLDRLTEAQWIMSDIMKKTGGSDLLSASEMSQHQGSAHFSDIAIVYRTHSVRRMIEKLLAESGYPFQVIGSESLFQRPHIRSVIEILQQIHLPERLQLTKVVEKIAQNQTGDFQLFNTFLVQFDKEPNSIKAFLDFYDNLIEHDFYDQSADRITVMTIHASKGLEFQHVYLCGFEEGMIPYKKRTSTREDLDEERRLLYVALTRAKTHITLLTTTKGKPFEDRVSQFFKEMQLTGLTVQEDDNLQKILKKRRKQKIKKNQLGLFG